MACVEIRSGGASCDSSNTRCDSQGFVAQMLASMALELPARRGFRTALGASRLYGFAETGERADALLLVNRGSGGVCVLVASRTIDTVGDVAVSADEEGVAAKRSRALALLLLPGVRVCGALLGGGFPAVAAERET